ncbi:3-ketoacyl-ACP reductase [Blastopirellula marina]|uniref:3-ketoacyl-(Acyl-carrier-protein) reductase n=1 Tax=Blastopirellula marina DSM 3645 TaxID=314230 RepID=A4A2B8_9BACT|nr:3-ketoacyl-ACP reductase [Blastopirellula marina]EAQ77084.1 3-ketoacyl-(acyl-carrier-protein) reductase [Blastopirellula marina DSM 3645]
MSKSLPVAVVTGSSRGIGRAIATALAADGFAVTINYNSRRDAADEVVAEIEAAGGRAIAVGASVAEPAGRTALLEQTLAAFGRLDLLVNNAGITSPGRKDLLEATEENWDLVFGTNLKGPFFLSQSAALSMIDQIGAKQIPSGKIINISSLSSYAVSANRADYCMAKAGLQMMTWLLAERLADDGIQVFEICPGVIASDMTAPVKEKYDQLIAEGMTPIRRWGQPEDVAKAILAIARDLFPFSTGERINVDGGFHLRKL